MKLRLHANSIRLRLNRDEVAEFVETGRIQDAIHFSGGPRLAYALEVSTEVEAPRAFLEGDTIRITVPAEDAQDWARSDRVGISAIDQQLSILVEKDFECLHEPDPTAFPHPDAAHY